jgi:hypothetical protein
VNNVTDLPQHKEEIIYSLFIENPKNPNIGDTIQFENREQMDSYIDKEKYYTRNELKALYRAITKSEREKPKVNLIAARFSFLSQVIKTTEEGNNEAG